LNEIAPPRQLNRYVAAHITNIMTLPPVTYQVLSWAFVVVASVTPVVIVALSVHYYRRRGRHDFETVRFKSMVAMLIWLVLTVAMMLLLGFTNFVIGHSLWLNPSSQSRPTLTYVAVHLIYFATCYLLIDRVARRSRVLSDAT
jgi:purine-cytosine permease-like protein